MMKSKIIFPLMVTLGLVGISNLTANAQSLEKSELETFQSNEVDPLYGSSGFNPMDLIHNANFLNGRTSADFAEDTNKQLDNATTDFKQQQLQRMIELQQQPNNDLGTIEN